MPDSDAQLAAQNAALTRQLLEWIGGSEEAFGPYPAASTGNVVGYGVVNLAIYAVGLGLVYLGHRLGSRRRERRSGAVHLDPVSA